MLPADGVGPPTQHPHIDNYLFFSPQREGDLVCLYVIRTASLLTFPANDKSRCLLWSIEEQSAGVNGCQHNVKDLARPFITIFLAFYAFFR